MQTAFIPVISAACAFVLILQKPQKKRVNTVFKKYFFDRLAILKIKRLFLKKPTQHFYHPVRK